MQSWIVQYVGNPHASQSICKFLLGISYVCKRAVSLVMSSDLTGDWDWKYAISYGSSLTEEMPTIGLCDGGAVVIADVVFDFQNVLLDLRTIPINWNKWKVRIFPQNLEIKSIQNFILLKIWNPITIALLKQRDTAYGLQI